MSSEQHIFEIAERLFLRYGLKNVRMEDVAAEAGISKKTLYQVVPAKADLVDRIVEAHIEAETLQMEEARGTAGNAIEEMLAMSGAVAETLGRISPGILLELRRHFRETWEKIDAFQRGHIYELVLRNIEQGLREGLYRGDLNAAVIAQLYVIKSMSLIDEDLFPAEQFDRRELVQAHIQYHLAGILSEAGRAYLKNTRS